MSSDGLDQGSTFTMLLPLVEKVAGVRRALTPSSLPAAIELNQSPLSPHFKSVLIVDDTASNRKMLCRLLSQMGCSTQEAKDGTEFVDLMKSFGPEAVPYDLVILDYEMPLMTGPVAVQLLRGLGFRTVVIGMTGNILPGDMQYFISCGADDVLPKPCVLSALVKSYDAIMSKPRDVNTSTLLSSGDISREADATEQHSEMI